MKKPKPTYYNLNITIFQDYDEFAYSVIQEFDEAGRDAETLVSGSAGSLEDALAITRGAVQLALE